MTEADYIDATNLAKIRIAKIIISDLFYTDGNESKRLEIVKQLREWEAEIEKRHDY